MVDETIAFLKKHDGQPCFVNLWFDDVHTPWVPAGFDQGKERKNLIAVIEEMDRQVGRLLDALPANTLLIFASDNGALPTLNGERNAGLRGSKLSLYEGGTRLPFIVRWPGHVPAGNVDKTSVIHAVDMFPTLAAIAGAGTPKAYQSDGLDLSSVLLGKPTERTKALFWEYGRNETSFKYPAAPDRSPNVAMLDGKWKLLINTDGTAAELYDIFADPEESTNVAGTRPDVTSKMKAAALDWRNSMPKLQR
jgi:arylsulfatase A-like enzyme